MKEVLKSDSLIELKMKKEYLLEYGIQSRILLDGKEITDIPRAGKTAAFIYTLPYAASLVVDDSCYQQAVQALEDEIELEILPGDEIQDRFGRTLEQRNQDRRRISGILLLLFGIILGGISVATICKIIVSGNRTRQDIELGIVMAVTTILALGFILSAHRRIFGRFSERKIRMQERKKRRQERKKCRRESNERRQERKKRRQERTECRQNQLEYANRKINVRYILLIAAICCIGMMFVLKGHFGITMIFVIVGNFCMIAFGTIRGVDFKKRGKWKYPFQLKRKIGFPIILYWLLVFCIFEFIVGW